MNIIKELFFPSSMFTQTFVGIEIGKKVISACQAKYKNGVSVVEKFVTEDIELSTGKNYNECAAIALKKVLSKTRGTIRITLPDNLVIFKDLELPFLDEHKIKMVLGYEIESSLPFSIHNAAYDCIIVDQNKRTKSSKVLALIAQKKHLEHYQEIFKLAGKKINISTATVDLLGVYNIYKATSSRASSKNTVLLGVGKEAITISLLQKNQLRSIRSLPYGVFNIIESASKKTGTSQQDLIDCLSRDGIDSQDEFQKIITDLAFTLSSFQAQASGDIDKIIVINSSTEIKGLATFIANGTGINSQELDFKKLRTSKQINIGNTNISNNNIVALASVAINKNTESFNLVQGKTSSSLAEYQSATAIVLSLLVLGGFYAVSTMQIGDLQRKLDGREKSARIKLKKVFNLTAASQYQTLDAAVKNSEAKIESEKKIWFSLSSQNRLSYLKYLQELSNIVGPHKANIDIKKLTFSGDRMEIQGSTDTEGLNVLEVQLDGDKSKYFQALGSPQDPEHFKFEIKLKQSEEK